MDLILNMTLKTYLFGILLSTTLSFLAFFLIIKNTNPSEGLVAVIAFYVSLFFGITGLFTLLGHYLRYFRSRGEVVYANIGVAFRQAFFVALASVTLLFLASIDLLNWWDGLLLFLVFLMVEMYFRAK